METLFLLVNKVKAEFPKLLLSLLSAGPTLFGSPIVQEQTDI